MSNTYRLEDAQSPKQDKEQHAPTDYYSNDAKKPRQALSCSARNRHVHPPQARNNVHGNNDNSEQRQFAKERVDTIIGLHGIDGEIGQEIAMRSRENLFKRRQILSHRHNVI